MTISIGPVDFSWLGKLPDVYDEARIKSEERALGSVDFNDPIAVSKRAGQLINIGDMEGALKLQQAAQSAKALNEQIAQRNQWMEFLKRTGPLEAPYGPSIPAPTPDIINPGAPGAAAPGPSPFPPGPTPLPAGISPSPLTAPRTELPPSLGAVDRGLAGLKSNMPQELTPSEQIIAAAQGAVQPTASGPQYAQAEAPTAIPGGQLSVTPGREGRPRLEVAPTAVPDWLKTGAFVPPSSAPAAVPEKPELTPADVFGDPLEAARRQYAKYQNIMRTMGPNTPLGVIKAYSSALDIIGQGLKTPQDWTLYQLDQRQNVIQKRPLESFGDWQQRRATAAGTSEEVRTFWDKEFWQPAQAARDVQRSASALEMVASDPAFVSGHLSESYGDIANAASTVLHIGQNLGLLGKEDAASFGAKLENLLAGPQNTVGLQDLTKGLGAKLTVGILGGSLGRSISDADRNFANTIASSLKNLPGGFVGLAQLVQLLAQHSIDAEATATKYRQDARANANVPDMVGAVRKYTEQEPLFQRKDGSLTPQGERLKQILQELKDRAAGKKTEVPTPTTYEKAVGNIPSMVVKGAQTLANPASTIGLSVGPEGYDPTVAPREVGRAASAAGGFSNPQAATLAAVRAVPQAARNEFNQIFPSGGPEPPRAPGPGPVMPTDVANRLVAMAGKEGVPDIASMISLRQSISPRQAADVQTAITQRLGSDKGVFDPTLWAENYNNLENKAKVGIFGGAAPGSLRSNYNDIASGGAAAALIKIVSPETIAKGLSSLVGSSALAAWARAYNAAQRANMTPAARVRLRLATDNLLNNFGLGGQ